MYGGKNLAGGLEDSVLQGFKILQKRISNKKRLPNISSEALKDLITIIY